MRSILQEIDHIRNGRPLVIDRSNRDRYRIVALESNGLKTAYYFSAPIYNQTSRKLLDMKFYQKGNMSYLSGSNSYISLSDTIFFEQGEHFCRAFMPRGYTQQSEHCITYQGVEIYPATNGIAFQARLDNEKSFRFRIEFDSLFYNIRHNGKYFALMQGKFNPFITVSCIGAMDANGNVIAPASIRYSVIGERKMELTVISNDPDAKSILFEMNVHEAKLFQDTTVESKHPKENNAFGGTAFIGNSADFGEQWLYSRPDLSKLRELWGVWIYKMVLYDPIFSQNHMLLSAHQLSSRFCSFGSNWHNKKEAAGKHIISELITGYQKLDVTNLMVQDQRLLTQGEGWIVRPAQKNSSFSAISTGDSCYAPQILEVTFQ